MPVSFVTPSTSWQTSSPNASRTSSRVAEVSSTVSWSSAAQSVSVSSRRPAQILATPTGWTMNSSPDLRRWSAWCSQAKRNAFSTRSRSIWTTESSACSSTIAKMSPSRERSSAVNVALPAWGACLSGMREAVDRRSARGYAAAATVGCGATAVSVVLLVRNRLPSSSLRV